MKTPNEFWLALHEMVQAAELEGSSSDERVLNVVQAFQKMPRPTQREILSEMVAAVTFLQELYPRVLVAADESA